MEKYIKMFRLLGYVSFNRMIKISIAVLFSISVLGLADRVQAQDIYATKLVDSTSDFQNGYKVVDNNNTNYAYISNLLTLLNSSSLRVQFPQKGKAGDVVNVSVQGTGQLLGVNLLNSITIRLFDSLGNNVKSGTGSTTLSLSLLSGVDSVYNIRFITNPSDTFTFTEAKIELNNFLTANLLNEFRIYNVYYQEPCPAIYADSVYAYGTNGTLTGYVLNSANAADANPNNYATLVNPLNILGLLPPAYLDLKFSQLGNAGEYVGFTIGQASTLLSLGLLDDVVVRIYDENNVLRETKSGFTLLDLRLLAGSTNRYSLGFVSQTGNYKISRLNIQLSPVLGLLQNLRVYNAFHYNIDRPPVLVTSNRSTKLCQGDSVTLTAETIAGATGYLWSNAATTQSITVSTAGTYYVTVLDSFSCSRRSFDIVVSVATPPNPIIIGDTVLCSNTNSGILSTSMLYASYLWSNAGTSNNININNSGTYYVTVTDANSCVGSDTVTVINNNLNIIPSITNTTCSNNAVGAISLNVSGGSSTYNYKWSTGSSNNSISNLKSGIYTAIISDSLYGCSYNRAYTISANSTLSIKSSVVNTTECGASDGKVAINIVGGSGNYSYTWSNGATTQNIENLSAGLYTVTVIDQTSGCQSSHTMIVSDGNNSLTVIPTVTNLSNCTNPNGAISLNVTGGSGNYAYLWSNNATISSLSGVNKGVYSVLVTDNSTSCAKAISIAVDDSAALTISGAITASACGDATGKIVLTISGGSGNYTYNWSDGSASATLNNVFAGTYIVTVTDNVRGCSASKVFTVGEANAPTATLTVTQPSCSSNGNGAISITTTSLNFYRWSNGSVAQNQSNLKPGKYSVSITDSITRCIANYTTTLSAKEQMSITANPKSNTSCASSPNGQISVNVNGGLAPYTYVWSNNATTQNITNIGNGSYTLNVSDNGGCTGTISVPVITDSNLLLNVVIDTVIKASCNTTNNASASITVTGGKTPYTYSWSNGSTTKDVSGVLAGNYSVTVTDAVGCSKTLQVVVPIDSANLLSVVVDSTSSTGCSGSATGAIYVTPSGGKTPYTYLWSNATTAQDLVNVSAGSYTLTVTDDNGCTTQTTNNVPVLPGGSIAVTLDSVQNASCQVSGDGNVYVSVSGGLSPYTYMWSNNATGQDLSNVNPGSYTLTATDANGCPGQLIATVGIDPSKAIVVTVDSLTGAGCTSGKSGAIYISASGGQSPYNYVWSNAATTQDLINVVPNTYSVTVTDQKGCTKVSTSQVLVDTTRSMIAKVDSVDGAGCIGSNSGSLYVSISKGIAPYTYSWSTGSTAQDLLDVAPGTYTLITSDASGCSVTLNGAVHVDSNKRIITTLDSIVGATCAISKTAQILVSISGGTAPYTYAWSNGATTQDLVNVAPGSYTLMVSDTNGCSEQLSANAGVDSTRSVQINLVSVKGAGCLNSPSGSIDVDVTGGTSPYMYAWSNGATTQDIMGVNPGSYTLTVTDNAGCLKQASANIGLDTTNSLKATVITVSDAKCIGSLSGNVDVDVTGGTPPYYYTWSNGATSQDLTFVRSGSYALSVLDGVGCTTQLSVNVGINNSNPVTLSIDSIIKVGCIDTTSGGVLVTTSGGVSPYVYQWSNGAVTEDLTNVPIGNYALIATDDAGCSTNITATVNKAPLFVINATVNSVSCYGDNNGSINVLITEGSGSYNYSWSNSATSDSIKNLAPGKYVINVMDRVTLCQLSDTFNVLQPDSLTAIATVTNNDCKSANSGMIKLIVSGGTAPYTYLWSNNAGGSTATDLEEGTYSVTINDLHNCELKMSRVVEKDLCSYDIIIPDVITPNGDGVNDTWVITGLDNYPTNSVQLYNKWGDIIYEQKNYSGTWSGTNSKGENIPDGTYYYLIKLNTGSVTGGKNTFTGFLMIKR